MATLLPARRRRAWIRLSRFAPSEFGNVEMWRFGNLEVAEMANETERATKRERSGVSLSEGPEGTAAERRTRAQKK